MLRHQPDLARGVSVVKGRELTELLLPQGMDPNRPDWLGVRRLYELARRGNVEGAVQLIDHGADLHARDEDIGSTPLGWPAKLGQRAMVELLIDRGAKPYLPDDPPWAAPLAWASRRRHVQIVELLRRGVK